MKIVIEKPPLWDEIAAAFPAVEQRHCLFAFGSVIYNPGNLPVPPELMAHELVHAARQKDDVRGWWRRYIDDPVFRLKEEVQAHKAEFARAALGVKGPPGMIHQDQLARAGAVTMPRKT